MSTPLSASMQVNNKPPFFFHAFVIEDVSSTRAIRRTDGISLDKHFGNTDKTSQKNLGNRVTGHSLKIIHIQEAETIKVVAHFCGKS